MQLQVPVACGLQDPQHVERLALEIPARRGHQLAVGQKEALFEQRAVGLRLRRRRPEGGADQRRLEHGGDLRDLARGQEVVAHEPLDAVLPAMPGVSHAGADHGLQIEGQPVFGAAGDVVQMEAHRPQERPRPPGVLGLAGGQDAAARAVGADQLAHHLGAEHVAAHPVQRLQVAQAAPALLDVGLDQERTVAVAMVPGVALGLLGGQERAGAIRPAERDEAALELLEQRLVAGQQPGVDHRGADDHVAFGVVQAVIHRPGRVADLQPEVPQEVQHELDGGERGSRGRVGRDEQQVDVAERRQHAAAIAAGGHDRERAALARIMVRTRILLEREAVEGGDHPVGQLPEQPPRPQAGHVAGLEQLLHMVLHARDVAPERGQRGLARHLAAVAGKLCQRTLQYMEGVLRMLRQRGR